LPAPQKAPVDLVELLRDLQLLLAPELQRRNIAFTCDAVLQKLVIPMDVQQMEQALLNILKNAMEAIGENGEIAVEVNSEPGQLIIKDNGTGIAEHVRKKLFTPFFSTKETGQGIGLTMVREILLNHGFRFNLTSDQEKHETKFEIYFQ